VTQTLPAARSARRVPSSGPVGPARLLAGWHATRTPASLRDHVARYGELADAPHRGSSALIAELESGGLAGRGGAGFPTHRKLRAVRSGGRPVVVVNGMEGEPLSAKDRLLLSVAPHLVLDGAVLAAGAIAAAEVHVCVPRGHRSSRAALESAIAERERRSPDRARIRVWELPPRYVAGEETAVIGWLNGKDAKPTTTPPRPFERGVRGRPTLVQNVETLAHVALIARFGASWFRSEGTTAEPGTLLLNVTRPEQRVAVLETASGTPIGQIVSACRLPDEPQAVLVGGYFGSWFTFEDAARLPLTQGDLRAVGGALGAGILAMLPPQGCGLCETARVARYLAAQSARQCGPCTLGLPAVARDLALLCHGRDPEARSRALRRMGQIEGRGACRHPDGAIRLIRSALRVFAEHVDWHERHGPCPAMHRTPMLAVESPTSPNEAWR
jgi:NADH:ubiquinone oxidoreductase subunit F (NADH-binding)